MSNPPSPSPDKMCVCVAFVSKSLAVKGLKRFLPAVNADVVAGAAARAMKSRTLAPLGNGRPTVRIIHWSEGFLAHWVSNVEL